MEREILRRKTQADNALERTAMQLQELLSEACAELQPFPPFPNALFTNAIELDAGPLADPEVGCVVVADDGEIYELQFGIDHESIELTGSWDPVTARKEEKKKLDLHPLQYVLYAYDALDKVTNLLLEREAEAAESGGDQ